MTKVSPYISVKKRYEVTYANGVKKEFVSIHKNIGRLANVSSEGQKVIDIKEIEVIGR